MALLKNCENNPFILQLIFRQLNQNSTQENRGKIGKKGETNGTETLFYLFLGGYKLKLFLLIFARISSVENQRLQTNSRFSPVNLLVFAGSF